MFTVKAMRQDTEPGNLEKLLKVIRSDTADPKIGNDLTINRLGISVSKKVGNSVVRHRMTRLVRESYRLHEKVFNSGLDIVVVVKPGASKCTYWEIESAMLHLAKLHGLD